MIIFNFPLTKVMTKSELEKEIESLDYVMNNTFRYDDYIISKLIDRLSILRDEYQGRP